MHEVEFACCIRTMRRCRSPVGTKPQTRLLPLTAFHQPKLWLSLPAQVVRRTDPPYSLARREASLSGDSGPRQRLLSTKCEEKRQQFRQLRSRQDRGRLLAWELLLEHWQECTARRLCTL